MALVDVIPMGMVPVTIVVVFYNPLGDARLMPTIGPVIVLVIFVNGKIFFMHVTSMKRIIIVKFVDID